MKPNDFFIIEKTAMAAIVEYLGTRPWGEVQALIKGVDGSPELSDEHTRRMFDLALVKTAAEVGECRPGESPDPTLSKSA